MLIKSIALGSKPTSMPNRRSCVVEIDNLKIDGTIAAVSYEEDLKNPEIWIEAATRKHALKITLNEKIASRGQAWLCGENPEAHAGENPEFDSMMEEFFKENKFKKYFSVDCPPKLFEKTISQTPPVKAADLYKK